MNQTNHPVVAMTGGSMGLGRALAEQLLKNGFAVALCARREAPLREAVSELQTLGPVDGVVGDVGDPFFRSRWLQHVVSQFGRLDALVNNASSLGDLPLPKLTDTNVMNLRKVFEVNTFAPLLLIQEALPELQKRARALVLNISSDAAVGGYPTWGVYGASKAALDLLTKTFASEHEASSVAFYAVDPSDMQTAMHEAASPGDDGLAAPGDVAVVLSSLFEPLHSGVDAPYPTGARLQVQGSALVVVGGE